MAKTEFALVSVPAAPVRMRANHRAEMCNQLLFGEAVKVLSTKGQLWLKVRSLHDKYEGWLTRHLVTMVSEEQARAYSKHVTTQDLQIIKTGDQEMKVPLGSSLPFISNAAGGFGKFSYTVDGRYTDRLLVRPSEDVVKQLTYHWLNAPYQWGGRTLLGVDCSGFVQVIHKLIGIDLPRDAWQQAGEGKTVKKIKDVRCGDLAFFDDNDEIVHVGILLGDGKIIHAAGKVRIDQIDKKGITNSETGKRTHTLQVIKRIW